MHSRSYVPSPLPFPSHFVCAGEVVDLPGVGFEICGHVKASPLPRFGDLAAFLT